MPAIDPALVLVLRLALALLFAVACAHKLRGARQFRATLDAYRLLPRALLGPAAMVIIGAEAALVLALIGGHPWAGAGAVALLGLYTAAIGVNLARGRREIDCGCGGPAARQSLSGALLVRNGVLIAAALGIAAPVGTRPLHALDAFTVVSGTVAALVLYVAANQLLALVPRLRRLRS